MTDKCILIIPGHNSHGEKPRFLALEKALVARGYVVRRFSAERVQHHEGGEVVLEVSEEYEQAKAIAEQLRQIHGAVIAAGHSQGGAVAYRLGYEGVVDGVVSMMGDYAAQADVDHHLAKIGKTLQQVRKEGYVRFERDSGQVNWYTAEWFEDYLLWNLPILVQKDYPKLWIAARDDPWNTVEKLRELYEQAAEPKDFVVIDSEHNFEDEHVRDIADAIEDWVEGQLD